MSKKRRSYLMIVFDYTSNFIGLSSRNIIIIIIVRCATMGYDFRWEIVWACEETKKWWCRGNMYSYFAQHIHVKIQMMCMATAPSPPHALVNCVHMCLPSLSRLPSSSLFYRDTLVYGKIWHIIVSFFILFTDTFYSHRLASSHRSQYTIRNQPSSIRDEAMKRDDENSFHRCHRHRS